MTIFALTIISLNHIQQCHTHINGRIMYLPEALSFESQPYILDHHHCPLHHHYQFLLTLLIYHIV